jgi:signal transduction histidine kinase
MGKIQEFNDIDFRFQKKILYLVQSILIIIGLAAGGIQYLMYNDEFMKALPSIMMGVLGVFSVLEMQYRNKLTFSKIVYYVVITIMAPISLHINGGIYSLALIWVPVSFFISFQLFSKEYWIPFAAVNIFQIFYIGFIDQSINIRRANESQFIELYIISALLALAIFTAVLVFSLQKRKQQNEELKHLYEIAMSKVLIATAAHEIRNPLTIVSGNIEKLKKTYNLHDEKSIFKIHEAIDRISYAIETIQKQIDSEQFHFTDYSSGSHQKILNLYKKD